MTRHQRRAHMLPLLLAVAAFTMTLATGTYASSSNNNEGYPRSKRIRSWTTHGINNFRGVKIMNLANDSIVWGSLPPISEVGVLNKDANAKNAKEVSKGSLRADLMANIHVPDLEKFFGVPRGSGPFNIPLSQVKTLRPFSRDIDNRFVPSLFSETLTDPSELSLYRTNGQYEQVTLNVWNYGRAYAQVDCKSAVQAVVKISINHGIPTGLYTVWDVGVLWPLAENETFSAGPFGGVPNVIATDSKGRGSLTRQINYCPLISCRSLAPKDSQNSTDDDSESETMGVESERQATKNGRRFEWWPLGLPVKLRPDQGTSRNIHRPPRCLVYLSLFYHFDNLIYGGSPALDNGGLPIGQVGGNQMQIFFQGERTQEHRDIYKTEFTPNWNDG